MRHTTFKRGGYSQGVVGTTGGELGGVTILSREPIGDLEAATKYYVDSKIANLAAGQFTTGVIPDRNSPAFTGDLVKEQGTNETTIRSTTISPGRHTKLTYNLKGQVTGTAVLVASDIPQLSLTKITEESRPTTLSGYGITDALSTSGGTLTGALQVETIAQHNNSAVTKQFVDNMAVYGSVPVGSSIIRPVTETPPGYLRENGGLVDKALYSQLYQEIGDIHTNRQLEGSGAPWLYQNNPSTVSGQAELSWISSGSIPASIYGHAVAITKNRVYIIGGMNASGSSGFQTACYSTTFNEAGVMGVFSTVTALPVALSYVRTFVTRNRLHVIGSKSIDTAQSSLGFYSAVINADGTLGAWTAQTNLPVYGMINSPTLVVGNYVYIFGSLKQSDDFDTRIVRAEISEQGTIGTWSVVGSVPYAAQSSVVFATTKRVYLIGGAVGGTTNTVETSCHSAAINADGSLGTWVVGTPFPTPIAGSQVVTSGDYVYVIGGATASNTDVSACYKAPVLADGTIGTWVSAGALPATRAFGAIFIGKNRLVILGGRVGGAASSSVIYTQFSIGDRDYSKYYDGSLVLPAADKFALPNRTAPDRRAASFIKY